MLMFKKLCSIYLHRQKNVINKVPFVVKNIVDLASCAGKAF